MIQTNDDWRATQEREIEDAGAPPHDDREAALVADLAPGPYTAIVRSQSQSGNGVGLVEVYTLK
ncbi:MAG: hypothetical protein M3Z64_03560 [Verrucomicrobiota bacterium]|nr:hypothetical protein [Verrucomicrobiota bacterium]